MERAGEPIPVMPDMLNLVVEEEAVGGGLRALPFDCSGMGSDGEVEGGVVDSGEELRVVCDFDFGVTRSLLPPVLESEGSGLAD